MNFGILGSGSWGTAIAKILTDNGHKINWWNRSEKSIEQLLTRKHNPHYLSAAYFDTTLLKLTTSAVEVVEKSDCIVIAVPSAYIAAVMSGLNTTSLCGKKIISAVKGILPDHNLLLNEFLEQQYQFSIQDYFAVLGPCHAEEIAAEKLSYLTFSGIDTAATNEIAARFKNAYINTVENNDIFGVQYAAILKNIYAVGAGMAHGLDYGDNFLSVLIANSADEMAGFLKRSGVRNIEVGSIEHHQTKTGQDINLLLSETKEVSGAEIPVNNKTNYAASVYLGDLLVTCYSLYSRNRMFGNMLGKGYSVKAAQIEMSMVAEGYNASRCMYLINQSVKAEMPVAETIYKILWENLEPAKGFKLIEETLV